VTGDPAERWARACWAAAEPFAIAAFFTEEARAAAREMGLPSIASYVVFRAAPLGAADPAVAAAAFRSFPRGTFDILPVAWSRTSPADAVRRTHAVVTEWCATVYPGQSVAGAADELAGVVRGLDTAGRPLAAANQAVPPPDEPWARLWRALTALREHRGDAHVAALVATGLTVPESEVLMAAWATGRVDLALLRRTRRIDDAAWSAATAELAGRGLLTATGALTEAGRALRDGVEAATDRASADPYRRLGADGTRRLWQLATELSRTLVDAGRFPSVTPVGAPWPPPSPGSPSR
jgi:hypothetical protein